MGGDLGEVAAAGTGQTGRRGPGSERARAGARVRDLGAILDQIAPPSLAESWDNGGLLLGDPESEPAWVAVALEAAFALAPDALPPGPGLLAVHHPLPFRPLGRLVAGDPEGDLILELARRGISLYAAHTSYDAAPGGLSHRLALALGLEPATLRPLAAAPGEACYKLVVFVPATHTVRIRSALAEAGAGWIGNYSDTAFAAPGRGYFRPREGSDPFFGQAGRIEEVAEDRLETIVPGHLLGRVLDSLRRAHPYEEPAFDVYPLAGHPPVTRADLVAGTGRVGTLAAGPMDLEAFRLSVERNLDLPAGRARLLGPDPEEWVGRRRPGDPGTSGSRQVTRVACCPGAGGSYIRLAAAAGADVYVTGDLGHHRAVEASRLGLPLIDAGHLGTEKLFVKSVSETLAKALAREGISFRVVEVRTPSGWRE